MRTGEGDRMNVFRRQAAYLLMLVVLLLPIRVNGAEEAVAHLSGLLEPVAAFRAGFTQTLLSAQGQTLQEVTGQLRAMRPGLFFWHTEAPLEQTVVTDGETVWIHDPDLEQVTIQPLDQQLASTPALLLSGEIERISEAYEVSYAQPAGTGEAQPDFVLHPRGPDSLFQWLTLHFAGDTLQAMSLVDSLGQKTLLRFDGAQRNPPLTEADFHFAIPEGVDVIRQTAE